MRDLPTEMEKRGDERFKDMYWDPKTSTPDIWVGIVFALLAKQIITPNEALGFAMELEAAGAGDTPYFQHLKAAAYQNYKPGE